MMPDAAEHQLSNVDFPINTDGEATKSSYRKLQYSKKKGIPRRAALGDGKYRL